MLFRKKIEKSCSYCIYSTRLDDEHALCVKKSLVSLNSKCRKFHYDPCKRVPPKPKAPDFERYSNEDYSL